MRNRRNIRITMSDGVETSADLYLPESGGPWPTVLVRTCYTKASAPYGERGAFWTSRDFAYVVQDVRGRGDSDGRFYPLVTEVDDGRAALDHIASQPWSDGQVFMTGSSYLGWTQLYAACSAHPALRGIVPVTAPPDPDRCFPVAHGKVSLSAAAWLAGLDGHINQPLDPAVVSAAFQTHPLVELDTRLGHDLTAWQDWISNLSNQAYWDAQSYQRQFWRGGVPMLHVSGWYDDCLIGAIENYTLASGADDAGVQRLLIGPWQHNTIGARQSGDIDFGAAAEVDLNELQHQWFAQIRQGREADSPPVQLFVMGRNTWLESATFPVAGTQFVDWHLHSDGHANSRLGDGALSPLPCLGERPDQFDNDPRDPVPYDSRGDWRQVGGPIDDADLELRQDILVYTSDPLAAPLLICGPLKVHLFASSSAPDTDWTAKLLIVDPDGRALRLNDGAVRARSRHGHGTLPWLVPSEVEEYVIDCWATCVEAPAGARLRLEISSSAAGKYDVNLNTTEDIGWQSSPRTARQTVFHDARRPSRLVLPVIVEGD